MTYEIVFTSLVVGVTVIYPIVVISKLYEMLNKTEEDLSAAHREISKLKALLSIRGVEDK